MSHHPHLKSAIDMFGSQAKLAEAMRCSQQQISYLMQAPRITVEMAMMVEEATGGAVSRADLRPDVFGARGAA